MKGTTVERRRYPRCTLRGQVSGRMGFRSVSPVDLSLGGVQIEHFQSVSPGTTAFLTLFFSNHEVTLKCTVARSVADRPVVQDDGEREIIYRTGLEFLSTTEDIRRVIGAYVSTACPPTSESL